MCAWRPDYDASAVLTVLHIDIEPVAAKAGHFAKIEPGRFENTVRAAARADLARRRAKELVSLADSVLVVGINGNNALRLWVFGKALEHKEYPNPVSA